MDAAAEDRVNTVRSLWANFLARDWAAARSLFRDEATMHWVASGEHLLDADAIVRVNQIYPEGWSLRVIDVAPLVNGDVHSIVEVTQDGQRFYANSRFSFDDGARIARITEYWGTFEAPPAWRTAEAIGAYRREE